MSVQELQSWLTVRQAAQLGGVSTQTVELWRRKGKIRAIRVGGRWLHDPESVTQHIAGR